MHFFNELRISSVSQLSVLYFVIGQLLIEKIYFKYLKQYKNSGVNVKVTEGIRYRVS